MYLGIIVIIWKGNVEVTEKWTSTWKNQNFYFLIMYTWNRSTIYQTTKYFLFNIAINTNKFGHIIQIHTRKEKHNCLHNLFVKVCNTEYNWAPHPTHPTTKKPTKKHKKNKQTLDLFSQIPQCIRQISHKAQFGNRNVHICTTFCYNNNK